jgi:hypothetical protein
MSYRYACIRSVACMHLQRRYDANHNWLFALDRVIAPKTFRDGETRIAHQKQVLPTQNRSKLGVM